MGKNHASQYANFGSLLFVSTKIENVLFSTTHELVFSSYNQYISGYIKSFTQLFLVK